MKVRELFHGVVTGKPLKLRGMYNASELDKALKTKPSRQTVTIRNSVTGEIIGKRSIWQA